MRHPVRVAWGAALAATSLASYALPTLANGSPSTRTNVYIDALKAYDLADDCSDAEEARRRFGVPPDHGSVCRNFVTPCVLDKPLSSADRLNGINARRVVYVKWDRYIEGWIAHHDWYSFYRDKAGWHESGTASDGGTWEFEQRCGMR